MNNGQKQALGLGIAIMIGLAAIGVYDSYQSTDTVQLAPPINLQVGQKYTIQDFDGTQSTIEIVSIEGDTITYTATAQGESETFTETRQVVLAQFEAGDAKLLGSPQSTDSGANLGQGSDTADSAPSSPAPAAQTPDPTDAQTARAKELGSLKSAFGDNTFAQAQADPALKSVITSLGIDEATYTLIKSGSGATGTGSKEDRYAAIKPVIDAAKKLPEADKAKVVEAILTSSPDDVDAQIYESLHQYDKAAGSWNKAGNSKKAAANYQLSYKSQVTNINEKYGPTSMLSKAKLEERNDEIKKVADSLKKEIGALSTNGLTEADQESLKEQVEIIDNLAYINSPPPGWQSIANFFNSWQSNLEGFSGASFFYSEDGFVYDQLDETMQTVLKGIPGWTSEICQNAVLDDEYGADAGFAFSNQVSGASAHIEGEVIEIQTLDPETNASIVSRNIYKVSFEVNPGSEGVGCDITFTPVLRKGSDSTPLILNNGTNDKYTFTAKRGDSPVAYSGQNMIVSVTENSYDEACLLIKETVPRSGQECLLGIDDDSTLCSKLIKGEEKQYTDFSCEYCDSMLGSFYGLGGGSTRQPTSSEQGTSGSSAGSGQPAKPSNAPIVNPDI